MELSKKTTILFSPESHRRLSELAERRGVSLGALVRDACASAYSIVDQEDRVSAVRALATLHLPVGSPMEMKRESVPDAATLMP